MYTIMYTIYGILYVMCTTLIAYNLQWIQIEYWTLIACVSAVYTVHCKCACTSAYILHVCMYTTHKVNLDIHKLN